MNTINPKEDMFADFFQVGQYNNLVGSTLMDKFSGAVISKVKNQYGLTDAEVNAKFNQFKAEGNTFEDLGKFGKYVEASLQVANPKDVISDDSIFGINPPKIETVETVDVSDVDFMNTPKKTPTILWIGLGVVALVGITILIVRRK